MKKQLCGRCIKLYRALENILIIGRVWRGRVIAAQASHGQVSAQYPATGGKNIGQDVLYGKESQCSQLRLGVDLVAALAVNFTESGDDQVPGKATSVVLVAQTCLVGCPQGRTAHHQVGKLVECGDGASQTELQAQARIAALLKCIQENSPVLFLGNNIIWVFQYRGRHAVAKGKACRVQPPAAQEVQ